jgi:hypothetical protein
LFQAEDVNGPLFPGTLLPWCHLPALNKVSVYLHAVRENG